MCTGHVNRIQKPVKGFQGIFVFFQSDMQLVTSVRNDPYSLVYAVGQGLGTQVGKVFGFTGDKSNALAVIVNICYAGRNRYEEDEEIRFAPSYAEGSSGFNQIYIPAPYCGVLIFYKEVQH